MLKSHRIFIAAIFALTLLIACGIGAYLSSLAYDHGQEQCLPTIGAPDRPNDCPRQIDTDRHGLPYLAESIASNPDPSSNAERERRDLAAQESMSVWAFWMMVFSAIGIAVTSVGTAFLLWQIKLTRQAVRDTSEATEEMRKSNLIAMKADARATRRALGAAEETKAALMIADRNARSAEDQIAIARETARHQLRAYVGAMAANYTFHLRPDGSASFAVSLELTNTGQTPAYKFRHVGAMNLRTFPSDIPDPNLDYGANYTLFPTMKAYIALAFTLNSTLVNSLQDGTSCIFAQAVVEYEDYEGNQHMQKVAYIAHLTTTATSFTTTNSGTLTFYSGEGN